MKSHYRVAIIGGGVVGASVACHLAERQRWLGSSEQFRAFR